jgi:hypothetical protein
MSFFDENVEYWGNKTKPIIDAGNGRLNGRSVKILADGKYLRYLYNIIEFIPVP